MEGILVHNQIEGCSPIQSDHFEFGHTLRGVSAPGDTLYAKQVHGVAIADADSSTFLSGKTEADGLYRFSPGTIAVRTADCLPILISHRSKLFAMAVHAGWKGLAGGIVQEALLCVRNHGMAMSDIVVMLGPSIGFSQFEVGAEVVEAFQNQKLALSREQIKTCAKRGIGDRWHFDLRTAAVFMLLNEGVNPAHISLLDSCTFNQKQFWPSYRRDGGIKSHIISWIRLNPVTC